MRPLQLWPPTTRFPVVFLIVLFPLLVFRPLTPSLSQQLHKTTSLTDSITLQWEASTTRDVLLPAEQNSVSLLGLTAEEQ